MVRFPAVVGSTRWTVSLAAMTAVTALSIDASLPAQPTFARTFDVELHTAQLTLSMFLIGFAFAQLGVGYLSDVVGRRPVLLVGLAMFALAGVACAAAPSIGVLVGCRVAQGVCAAAPPVVARAMVRDTHAATEAARKLSTMLAALAVAPMIAPVIGGVLLDAFGWRSIFVMLVACGVVLFAIAQLTLVETSHTRAVGSLRGLVRGFRTFFTTPGTRTPTLVACASFAGQFAYISDSPFVLIGGYGVPEAHFGYYFAITALALMLGSLFGGRMLRAGATPHRMLVVGTAILAGAGVLVAIGTRIPDLGIAGFIAPMIVYFFGVGIASPSATALALEPVPEIAGTASSALGFSTMISGAIAGYATTRIGGSSPQTFAIVVLAMGVLAFALAASRRPRARTSD